MTIADIFLTCKNIDPSASFTILQGNSNKTYPYFMDIPHLVALSGEVKSFNIYCRHAVLIELEG